MNNDKTEIMICSTPHNVKKINITSLAIDSSIVTCGKSITNLGVYLDETLNMEHQISKLSQSLFIEIRKLGHIRPYLSITAAKRIASAFILSRIDYCNSLLTNCSTLKTSQHV